MSGEKDVGLRGWLTGPRRSGSKTQTQTSSPDPFDKHRIAVLPFTNMSPDPADEYFADGLTEELIAKLSLVKGLRVIARTSVMNYKKKEKRVSEIGKELGVSSLVEGSVRKSGNKIRVTAQLIDVGTEEHLWSSSYDKDLDDIFMVQTDVASNIAGTLPGNLSLPQRPEAPMADATDVTAYSYYLKGRHLMNAGTDEALQQALELFTKATQLNPTFARAYAQIGRCYADLGVRSRISYNESISGMKSGAKKALEIDPNLAEAHALLAYVAWAEDDLVNDDLEGRRAIELNPNLAEAYGILGLIRASKGYAKESTQLAERAHLLDPLSAETIGFLGRMYFYTGREGDALQLWNSTRAYAPYEVSRSMALYFMSKKDFEKAEEQIKTMEALAPADSPTLLFRGCLMAIKADKEAAEKIIVRLQHEFQRGPTLDRNIGYIRYFLGDMDAFFAAMFRAVDSHVFDPIQLRYSPLFEKARQDSRYREVMARNRLDPDVKG